MTSRTSIDKVQLGWICFVIGTQNKAEVSICGVKMFYIQVSFGHQKMTVEYKLWCQSSSYLVYVVTRHLTTRTCCLLRAVVSNGMFLRASAFCTQPACSRFPVGVTYLWSTKSELTGPHRLMSIPDTCIGLRIHVSIYGGVDILYLD